MNSSRKILWCLCLGVWLALVMAFGVWKPLLTELWRDVTSDRQTWASAPHEPTATVAEKAVCLEELREAKYWFHVVEAARRCAESGCLEAVPLLRRIYYNENILYNDIHGGGLPFRRFFISLCELEGRPIDALEQARANIERSFFSPDLSPFCPNPALFSRYPAMEFILRCPDREAAGFEAILLARWDSKYSWGSRTALRRCGRDLLEQLPREAAQPLLSRIRCRMGSDLPAEDRLGSIRYALSQFSELYGICGVRSHSQRGIFLGVCLLPFQFVLSLGLIYIWLVYLGVRCLADYRRQTRTSTKEETPGPQFLKLRRIRAASCAALVVACWAPVVVRVWIMLAIAYPGKYSNPLLGLARWQLILDTILTLMLVSTPALVAECVLRRRLERVKDVL